MRVRVAICVLALTASGCANLAFDAPVKPPIGGSYGHNRAPVDLNFVETQLGSKVGSAQTRFIREPFCGVPIAAWGEASVEAAAKSAGIQHVNHVDYEFLNVLNLYAELTVWVYGD